MYLRADTVIELGFHDWVDKVIDLGFHDQVEKVIDSSFCEDRHRVDTVIDFK